MNRHPIDSTALIFGLLFGLAGMAILIDETVPDVDATMVTGVVVGALGIAFVATLVTRQVRLASPTSTPAPSVDIPAPPTIPGPPTTEPIDDEPPLDDLGTEAPAADESTQD